MYIFYGLIEHLVSISESLLDSNKFHNEERLWNWDSEPHLSTPLEIALFPKVPFDHIKSLMAFKKHLFQFNSLYI